MKENRPLTSRTLTDGVRRPVEFLVYGLIAVVAWRTWFLEGLPVPFVVSSGSMATTLLGPHRDIVCGDCGYPFVCGCDRPTADPRAVCPNCGYAGNDVHDWPELPGDRVLVHRAMFDLRAPRRWEVVALRTPGREREVSVKRVVGLPGEKVEIRDGRVHIDGRLTPRTLAEQQATSVLVYDARYVPHLDPRLPPRWRPDSPASRWSRKDGVFTHPGGLGREPIDWLVYRHWRRIPWRPGTAEEGPVLTETSYNQGNRVPPAIVHPTMDVRLSFRVLRTSGDGALCVRAVNGLDRFLIRIAPQRATIEVLRDDLLLEGLDIAGVYPHRKPYRVDVSLFDQQLLVALDGRTVFVRAMDAPAQSPQPGSQPFALGTEGLSVELDQAMVLRAVSYDTPDGRVVSRSLAASSGSSDGGYFVVGDNPPISEDSRAWSFGHAPTEDSLWGKPFLVHFPTCWWVDGKWRFRIPDISAIRYIR